VHFLGRPVEIAEVGRKAERLSPTDAAKAMLRVLDKAPEFTLQPLR
jgi:hypothetical protein